MGNLSIQPNKGIPPLSGDFSNARAQLAAKDNTRSSIDQKSTGCFSSLWNSFVSLLSSIWNFFTACCTSKQEKDAEKQKKTSKTESPEKISSRLEPKDLKKQFHGFATDANKELDQKIKSINPQNLKHCQIIWWIEINNKKHLVMVQSLDSLTPVSEQIDHFNTDDLSLSELSRFSMRALLMKWTRSEDNPPTPFEYSYVGRTVSVEDSSSDELNFKSIDSTENSKKLTINDADTLTDSFLSNDQEDSQVRKEIKGFIY